MKTELTWITPKSSQIKRFAYSAETQTLTVEFASGGAYEYSHVTPGEFDGMQHAESAGKFLHAQIKGKKPFKKVEPAQALPMNAEATLMEFHALKMKIIICLLKKVRASRLAWANASEKDCGNSLEMKVIESSYFAVEVAKELKIEFVETAYLEIFQTVSFREWALQIANDVVKAKVQP